MCAEARGASFSLTLKTDDTAAEHGKHKSYEDAQKIEVISS
jgi:hypothetical protein